MDYRSEEVAVAPVMGGRGVHAGTRMPVAISCLYS